MKFQQGDIIFYINSLKQINNTYAVLAIELKGYVLIPCFYKTESQWRPRYVVENNYEIYTTIFRGISE